MNWIECARPMKGTLEAKPISGEQEKRVNAWLAKHAPKEWKAIRARMQIAEPTEDDRRALEASMAARDAEGEWEDVPHTEWKIGDAVTATRSTVANGIKRGHTYRIINLNPTPAGAQGVNVEGPDYTCAILSAGWPADLFRLRRRPSLTDSHRRKSNE